MCEQREASLVYEKGGLDCQGHALVILATGGFGADFTQQSLLAQYRLDLMHLAVFARTVLS